jgi:hypothetical protein
MDNEIGNEARQAFVEMLQEMGTECDVRGEK